MFNFETISMLQRYAGMFAYILITLQILLSVNRKFTKAHMFLGIITYLAIFMHPLLTVFTRYLYGAGLDPFYVYVDFCVLCDGPYETFVNLGRIGFALVTLTVITAKLRGNISIFVGKKAGEWVNNNWRKLHLLNYVVFFLISIHAKNIGSDMLIKGWFYYAFWICQVIVLGVLLKKLLEKFVPKKLV